VEQRPDPADRRCHLPPAGSLRHLPHYLHGARFPTAPTSTAHSPQCPPPRSAAATVQAPRCGADPSPTAWCPLSHGLLHRLPL
jgi:hypothetical protein